MDDYLHEVTEFFFLGYAQSGKLSVDKTLRYLVRDIYLNDVMRAVRELCYKIIQ